MTAQVSSVDDLSHTDTLHHVLEDVKVECMGFAPNYGSAVKLQVKLDWLVVN